jgi:hypothetical protein
MAVVPKNYPGAGRAPSASSLVEGELALNTGDGCLYTKLRDGRVVKIVARSYSGDEQTGGTTVSSDISFIDVLDVTSYAGSAMATVPGTLILDAGNGKVELQGGSGNSAELTFNCSANSHGVTIKSPPHSDNATYSLILPTTAGTAGQVLTTNGSAGVLSWSTMSSSGTNHGSNHHTGGADELTPANIGAAAASHSSNHHTGGSDALTPANIGAAAVSHSSSHHTGGSDALTPANIGAAAASHASNHHTGGSDALTPASIGAPASTTITHIVKLTQAQYNALSSTPATTLYIIT